MCCLLTRVTPEIDKKATLWNTCSVLGKTQRYNRAGEQTYHLYHGNSHGNGLWRRGLPFVGRKPDYDPI